MTHLAETAEIWFRGLLYGSETGLPGPILYVSTNDSRARDYLIPTVKRYGLPILKLDGPEEHATLVLEPACGEWSVAIGDQQEITVRWPCPDGDLVYDGRMTSAVWCQAALQAGMCLLMVGPPGPMKPEMTIADLVEMTWMAGGALGMVAVSPGQADGPDGAHE
ncbi:hypothetical protein AB0395_35065 [Streptosporangium sp. NPDC051023]|uniref:hypothetical protein n=1 Tax=Streptosporangium sp. NPDC051023 TaxID=3155410 RepID=UPI00344B50DA